MQKIIAFEGPDGCGKSTAAERVAKKMGYPLFRSPNRELFSGEIISEYLKSGALEPAGLQLLFAANRWEQNSLMRDIKGPLIIDRYIHSGIAYGVAQGLDFNWCSGLNRGLPMPDVVFYFGHYYRPQKSGLGEDDIFENNSFQKKVTKAYAEMSTGWIVVPPGSIEEVVNFICGLM